MNLNNCRKTDDLKKTKNKKLKKLRWCKMLYSVFRTVCNVKELYLNLDESL